MDIVAEGIESRDSYIFLQNAGCTTGQGYWISKPLPLEGFLAFASRDQEWPALRLGLFHMAQLDHIQWRKTLMEEVFFHSFADGGQSPGEMPFSAVELDHASCRLGKWYYGQGRVYRGVPLFDKLEAPHRRLHEIGAELVEAANRGADGARITSLMRSLSEQSAQVIRILQELENNELSQLQQEHPELVAILLQKGVG